MDIEELKQFLQENNLSIALSKANDSEHAVTFNYQGYKGDKLIFAFNVELPVTDVRKFGLWELIEHAEHAAWLYSIFLEHEEVKPLERYTEGLRGFIKALNLYGPPVIWSGQGDSLLHIATDSFNTEHGFCFFLAGQKVAQLSTNAIITPSLLGRPVNLFVQCKACFSISTPYGFICEMYWPVKELP